VESKGESPAGGLPAHGRATWTVFFCILALLLLGSPGYLLNPAAIGPARMGYTAEAFAWADFAFNHLLGHEPMPVKLPRHGPLEATLVTLPLTALSRATTDAGIRNFVIGLQPILLTAALGTVLFLWVAAVSNPRRAALWTAVGVFTTILWPYAYMGMETGQSLALALAMYFSVGPARATPLRRGILFAVFAGLALSLKVAGMFLLPAMAVLFWAEARREPRNIGRAVGHILLTALPAVALMAVQAHFRQFHGYDAAQHMTPPLTWPFHFAGLFFSLNKGLIVYAPCVFLAGPAVVRIWRTHRDLCLSALLAIAGLAGGTSLLLYWTDETWGCRYLHSSIVPLVVVAALGEGRRLFHRRLALCALAVMGGLAAVLGCLFDYGVTFKAAVPTTVVTLERLQGDPSLNEIQFRLGLLGVLIDDTPGPVPSHRSSHVLPAPTGDPCCGARTGRASPTARGANCLLALLVRRCVLGMGAHPHAPQSTTRWD